MTPRMFSATLSSAALLTAMLAACSSGSPSPTSSATSSQAGACLASGTDVQINTALTGEGTVVELCQGAVFALRHPIQFTAARQALRTQGNPNGDARALLKIDASTLTTAIDGLGRSGIVVESVRIDGGRSTLGKLDGQALIEIGGNATDQTVHNIAAGNTRSWSTLHVTEGGTTADNRSQCRRATISGNTLGPAGTADGNWADGISLACSDSVVRDNVIRDATDGAIVIFGSPGSTIEANTIIAAGQTLLGGINMVDFDVLQGNFTGVKVIGNTIDSQGALIKVGIGMGPQVWFCKPGTNYGATVTGNTVKGDKVGYSFPVNGVRDWTVAANIDLAHHVGLPGPGCGGMPSAPGGFQVQAATNSNLQPGYASGALTYLLGVYEPGTPPTGCASMYAEQPLHAGQRLSSCDGRFSLSIENGRLVLGKGSTVLWSAGNGGSVAVMRSDGNFTLQDANAHTVWSAGTAGHPGASLALQDDGNLVVHDAAGHPIWATHTSA